jgi:hypothetical protein
MGKFYRGWRKNVLASRVRWPCIRSPSTLIALDESCPVHEHKHRARVLGMQGVAEDPEGTHFRASGFFDIRVMLNISEVYDGRSLSSTDRVLDWGVGCGRMIRYLPSDIRNEAVDVDPINIDWCERNFKFGNFLFKSL